ncbi:MAG TPA: IS110 family transposase [Phycisphaerales bacterium]|nr:IS110 family transposase [Phycisphaerales bacterium]
MADEPRTEDSFDPAPLQGVVVQNLKPYGVGIDTHKSFIQVCVLVRDMVGGGGGGGGAILRHEQEFSTDWKDLLAAKDWALARIRERSPLPDPDELEYVIESTGTYHRPVIRAWRSRPSVVNPLLASPSRRKTDVIDARYLAQSGMVGLWPRSFQASDECTTLAVIMNERADALRTALRARNRIENIVLRYGHTFHAGVRADSPEVEGMIELLLNVDHIDDAAIGEIRGLSPTPLPLPVRRIVGRLYADMKLNKQRSRELAREAEAYVRANEWPGPERLSGGKLMELLTSVPGVGPLTALVWISQLNDPARFVSAKQVAAFCGCDPSLKISAGKVTSYTRRGGNKQLRKALLMAAAVVLRKTDEPLGQWGRSIMGRHKKAGWKRACGAVARRLAVSMWHVHRTGTMYDPSKVELATNVEWPSVDLESMLPPRFASILAKMGFVNSAEVAKAYYDGLGTEKGVGEGCLAAVREWCLKHRPRTGRRKPTNPASREGSASRAPSPAVAASTSGRKARSNAR